MLTKHQLVDYDVNIIGPIPVDITVMRFKEKFRFGFFLFFELKIQYYQKNWWFFLHDFWSPTKDDICAIFSGFKIQMVDATVWI
jgi:hypothetical protein